MLRSTSRLLPLALALALAACQDGTDLTGPGSRATGKGFTLLLTDAPGDFVSAVVTISQITIQGDGQAVPLLDEPYTGDLLDLRNEVVLTPTSTELPPAFAVNLKLSGEWFSSRVLAKAFDARTDSGARVGLFTSFRSGIIESALGRLRIPTELIDSARTAEGGLPGFNVLLLDREALSAIPHLRERSKLLDSWVREGGHLVIFPQQVEAQDLPSSAGIRFRPLPAMEPAAPIIRLAGHPLTVHPNELSDSDWGNWVVARSPGPLEGAGVADTEQIVRAAATGQPLLVSRKVGKGRVTIVALDLVSQLTNIHPGAHRILANLAQPAW